jgi:hypothetical protein
MECVDEPPERYPIHRNTQMGRGQKLGPLV